MRKISTVKSVGFVLALACSGMAGPCLHKINKEIEDIERIRAGVVSTQRKKEFEVVDIVRERGNAEVVQEIELSERYPEFRFPDELETIDYHARRIGVETSLLLAIREAENGREGLQFGIIPSFRYENDQGYLDNGAFHEYPEDNDLSRQVSWAGATIIANRRRFANLDLIERSRYEDFIDFLGSRYAPENANNDPNRLNNNWTNNVRQRYEVHLGN